MVGFLAFLGVLVVLAAIAGPIVFTMLRRSKRQQKNYERGLKMVPLMIHLPPLSEDTAIGGRDTRDVIDETISKAQIIYNILSSTAQKGFKTKLYGQRHFAFEIVSSKGFVYFYAAVPITLVELLKQAVVSAYPSAQLEEASEHNIFSPIGRINGTVGGELTLKESFAYPIATYQDLKRDALQSVLDALSTLQKEDGAGIQILLRPADSSWRKTASTLASKKRKGDDKKLGIGGLAKDVAVAFVKTPGDKKDSGGDKKELSNLEQSTLDAIDDKTRHSGYEVQIRIVASSNISQRAQSIINNIVASFTLFDAPGKNGFKYTAAEDTEEFVTDYIMRFFKPGKKNMILNAVELATIFHFPDQKNVSTSQLGRQDSKQVDGPRNVPEAGLLLGYNVFRGVKKPIRIELSDRQRHMYVAGQTGTGKSTFLENLAFQDMLNGDGFAFVDPHGDTAERLLSMIPRERTEDVIYFSPADMDFPMGLNLFEFQNEDQKDFLIQEALNMLYKLYDPQHQGIMGPRYEHLFRMAALTVMADPAGGTFIDIPKLFRDPKYVQQKLQYVKDQNVIEFWQKEMPQSQRSNEFGEVVSWFVSKFGAFLSNEMMRNIIGQNKSAFDLRDIMDNKKILLVNLSKGRLGDLNSKLLGMIFVMKFQAAAMSRSDVPEEQRQDFCLYVDEFQNFSTDSFATIMSEARKYHLNLVVANQFTTQLTPEIRDAVFGNIGTIASFRIGQNDVEGLGKYFAPTFDGEDLLRVPNHNTIVRTLINGVPTAPFSMATLPPLGNPNPQLAVALKQLSAAKFGRPRAVVEKEIFARLATKPEPAKPAFGAEAASSPFGPPSGTNRWQAPSSGQAATPVGPSSAPPAAALPGSGSFLDEWLSKRQSLSTAAPAPIVVPQPPAPQPPAPAIVGHSQAATLSEHPDVTYPEDKPNQAPNSTDDSLHNQMLNLAGQLDSPAKITGNTNISSEEAEMSEVSQIAKELKNDMGSKKPAKQETPAVPTPALAPSAVPIATTSTPPVHQEDDTIVIDQEGNLHQRDEDTKPPAGK